MAPPGAASDPPADPPADPWLQRYREIFTGALAVLVITGFTIMLVQAMRHTGDPGKDEFSNIKELLAIVSPLVGVVIGYYFSKTATEARAEAAERTARSATTVARAAEQARVEAERKVMDLSRDTQRLFSAAESYVATAPPDGPGTDTGVMRTRIELEAAVRDHGRAHATNAAS